jgi:hypothetical protein
MRLHRPFLSHAQRRGRGIMQIETLNLHRHGAMPFKASLFEKGWP